MLGSFACTSRCDLLLLTAIGVGRGSAHYPRFHAAILAAGARRTDRFPGRVIPCRPGRDVAHPSPLTGPYDRHSTHELEFAPLVADRVWLFDAEGRLRDPVPEKLMLAGYVGALLDCSTLRFDPAVGAFIFQGPAGKSTNIQPRER